MTLTVTAHAIVRAIRAADASIPVTVAQTGGGCATVYAGEFSADGYAALAIGPGSFDWREPLLSVFALNDLYAGLDDGGGSESFPIHTMASLTAYVRAAIRCPYAGCGGPSDGSECRHPRQDD